MSYVVENQASPVDAPVYLQVSKRKGLWDGRHYWTEDRAKATEWDTRDGAAVWARKHVTETVRVTSR